MLIIEGPDLVGKTALAKRLEARHEFQDRGMIYRHLSRLPPGFDTPWQYRSLMGRRTIYDRFHVSEPAYCYARGEASSQLSPEKVRLLDGWLRGLGAFTVLITADDDLLRERHAKRAADEMYPVETVLRANEAFRWMGNVWVNGPMEPTCIDERYRFDFDVWLHCTADRPWPSSEQWIDNIVDRYLERQAVLEHVLDSADEAADYGVR